MLMGGSWLALAKEASPSDSPSLSPAAIKLLRARKQEYYNQQLTLCLQEIRAQASKMVDSASMEQALFIGSDTLDRPIRPERPEAENFDPVNINTPLKPFLSERDFLNPFRIRDSLVRDSIRRDSLRLDSLNKTQKIKK